MLTTGWATPLKYFSDIASFGSFSEAARKNFVSQSAMSQAVKKLENQLGFPLFEHNRNHFQLSPQGRALYERLQPLLRSFDSLGGFLSDLKGEKGINIEFGCMHSFALAVLPWVIPSFRKEYPEVSIGFRFGHGGTILESVRKGEIDFGIVLDNDDLSPFTTISIHEGYYQVFSRPDSQTEQWFLFSEPSYETNLFKKRYKEEYGETPPVMMNVASWEVIASLTEQGVGLGFFPDYLTIKHPRLRPIQYSFPSLPYAMMAVFREDAYLTTPIRVFLEMLTQRLGGVASLIPS